MCADEFDENAFVRIGDMNDEAIFIAADVEDNPIVADEVDRVSEVAFYVRRPQPRGFGNSRVPN